ncbi:hypothetical protein HWV62_15655 [Athelia sp. TMB]|nr:hypothetical protein HWV62_15655 [Athelia sp. TMB]
MNTSRVLSTHSHLAGSDANKTSALHVLSFFQDSFSISPPSTSSSSSASDPTVLPIYKTVFAGEGTPEDFAMLKKEGIVVRGKVVLAQYSGNYRGMKVKAASDAGAAAAFLSHRPRKTGSSLSQMATRLTHPVLPAMRVPYSVGAYRTRGRPAYEDTKQDCEKDGEEDIPWGDENLAGIVSAPVGWADAERLLEAARVKGRALSVSTADTKVTPIRSVMAAIPGHTKDEVVVLGDHRDDTWRRIKRAVSYWFNAVFCVGGCGTESRKQLEKVERDQLMRDTGYWAEVAFKSAHVEEGLSAHVNGLRGLTAPRPTNANKSQDGFKDDDCDHDLNSEPVRKLIKAAKRARRANRKLIVFERGFIDEHGFSGREWCKHLGVALACAPIDGPRLWKDAAVEIKASMRFSIFSAERGTLAAEKDFLATYKSLGFSGLGIV